MGWFCFSPGRSVSINTAGWFRNKPIGSGFQRESALAKASFVVAGIDI
jgi:hypothetical protein